MLRATSARVIAASCYTKAQQAESSVAPVRRLPNDEAVARLALANASMGTVRTETLRAFTEDEYRKIIAALP